MLCGRKVVCAFWYHTIFSQLQNMEVCFRKFHVVSYPSKTCLPISFPAGYGPQLPCLSERNLFQAARRWWWDYLHLWGLLCSIHPLNHFEPVTFWEPALWESLVRKQVAFQSSVFHTCKRGFQHGMWQLLVILRFYPAIGVRHKPAFWCFLGLRAVFEGRVPKRAW